MTQKNNNPKDHFECEDKGIEGGGIGIGRKIETYIKPNYTPYIIGGVILLAILAALIF